MNSFLQPSPLSHNHYNQSTANKTFIEKLVYGFRPGLAAGESRYMYVTVRMVYLAALLFGSCGAYSIRKVLIALVDIRFNLGLQGDQKSFTRAASLQIKVT